MNSGITEELFFTGLIGNVSIDSIIPYILKMETAEYNSQDSDPTDWQPIAPAPGTFRIHFRYSYISLVEFNVEPHSKVLQQPLVL